MESPEHEVKDMSALPGAFACARLATSDLDFVQKTLIVLFPAIYLMWRSILRLEGRLGKRIDDTNNRFDETSAALGARIDGIDNRLRAFENGQAEIRGKLDFVEAYILGRNDTRTAPAE